MSDEITVTTGFTDDIAFTTGSVDSRDYARNFLSQPFREPYTAKHCPICNTGFCHHIQEQNEQEMRYRQKQEMARRRIGHPVESFSSITTAPNKKLLLLRRK